MLLDGFPPARWAGRDKTARQAQPSIQIGHFSMVIVDFQPVANGEWPIPNDPKKSHRRDDFVWHFVLIFVSGGAAWTRRRGGRRVATKWIRRLFREKCKFRWQPALGAALAPTFGQAVATPSEFEA